MRLLFFMKNKDFNVTQEMTLLLLKPLNLTAYYVLKLIDYITNSSNNIGFYDSSQTSLVLIKP